MSNGDGLLARVPVLLPLPLRGKLDYAVPAAMIVQPGDIVQVPLHHRSQYGVVWDGDCSDDIAPSRLKAIEHKIPRWRLEQPVRQFIDWVAGYTLAPPGDVLAMALRTDALTPDRPRAVVRAGAEPPGGTSPARRRVLCILADQEMPIADLARAADVSTAVIRAMVGRGLLAVGVAAEPAALQPPFTLRPNDMLSPDQSVAARVLSSCVTARAYSVTLLHGATGSGKTMVYFEAVLACLAIGRQALVLLPEIALTTQVLHRFEERFAAAAAIWHSDVPARARRQTWRAAADGRARVVVGARSALFLPFADLGLIVVDEEHDSSFKQEEGVIYHARDMAVVRGRLSGAAVVLASATPSLETIANVQAGRYAKLNLPTRFAGAALPLVATVDLRRQPPERGRFLAPPLLVAIEQTLGRGEQVMLFLNRRGYAPLTLCRACGFRLHCPNCTAWLVEHRLRRALMCHHCGLSEPIPTLCPACSAQHSLAAVGPGVERITEEVTLRFPQARQLVMASDTLLGPKAAWLAAAAVEARQIDIIIGTQIAAKGWHFPHLTLVGVVDADLGLAGGDLRAAERTVQLLHQVSGRAGRAALAGTALLQTYQPDHPVMQALVDGDLERFTQAEADHRKQGQWPPYGRLAAIIVSAASAETVDAVALALGRTAPSGSGLVVLGPAPAPMALLRGRHRRRLLLRAEKSIAVQPLLRLWLAQVRFPRSVRVVVDIDPCSFL